MKSPESRGPSAPISAALSRPGAENYGPQVLQLLLGLHARGLDLQPLLLQAGIDAGMDVRQRNEALLASLAQCELPRAAFLRLVHVAMQTLGDEFLGFTQQPCRLGTFDLIFEMALHSQKLEAALQSCRRCYAVITGEVTVELQMQAEEVAVHVRLLHPELDPNQFLVDYLLLQIYRLLTWLAGRGFPVLRVEHSGKPRDGDMRLTRFLHADLHVEQPHDAFVFHRSYLGLPVVRTLEQYWELRAQARAGYPTWPADEGGWAVLVRSLVRAELLERRRSPSRDEVAQRLGLSLQTLRRKLLAEGTQFHRIRDDLRRDIAIEKLLVQGLSVIDLADQLGFAEPRSFTRAFKAWTGYSPSECLTRSHGVVNLKKRNAKLIFNERV